MTKMVNNKIPLPRNHYNSLLCKNCKNRYVKLTSDECIIFYITTSGEYNTVTCTDNKGNTIKNKMGLATIVNE